MKATLPIDGIFLEEYPQLENACLEVQYKKGYEENEN